MSDAAMTMLGIQGYRECNARMNGTRIDRIQDQWLVESQLYELKNEVVKCEFDLDKDEMKLSVGQIGSLLNKLVGRSYF